MDLATKDTSKLENNNNGDLFYFNDSAEVGYGVAAARRNPPFPIFEYGLNGALPESLGVLNLLNVFARSPTNGEIVFQFRGTGSMGVLNVDSLKKNLVSSEIISTDNLFGDISGFDFSKSTGNFILFTNSRFNGGDPGLYVGNINNKISTKNISSSTDKDE
jgi:hypothetical protein